MLNRDSVTGHELRAETTKSAVVLYLKFREDRTREFEDLPVGTEQVVSPIDLNSIGWAAPPLAAFASKSPSRLVERHLKAGA